MKKVYFSIVFFSILFFSCKQNNQENEIPDSRSRIIEASVINKKIKKGEGIAYRNATIIGDIDFTGSNDASLITGNLIKHYVNSAIVFSNCTFKGKISAFEKHDKYNKITEFKKGASFFDCTFQDTVDFTSSEFKDIAVFSSSIFQKEVLFRAAYFGDKGLRFNKTRFIKNAKFNMLKTAGICNFSDAVFDGNVVFQLSEFEDPVYFNAARFNENSDFTKVKFNDDVFFNYAEFYKTIRFSSSGFRARTEFIKTEFNLISEFKNSLFYGEVKFKDAKISGIITFENSIFFISDPGNFECNLLKETDFLTDNVTVLLKNTKINRK
ncbi:MAG: hypothetical protein GXO50_09970 [Chlorobi bacterium]|nr:hypothetical protein [Chlorobiota bacterium]